MKNLAIVALLFSAFVLTMSSCKKVEAPNEVNIIENAGTATISGIAYAEVNDTTSADTYAPAGTTLLVEVDPNDFPGVSTSNYNDNMMYYTVTVGANGAWSASIPAPKTPITVWVYPQDFRADYINGAGDTETAEFYFESCDMFNNCNNYFSMPVVEGGSAIYDFWYDRN